MDVTILGAIIGAIATLIASLLGGFIGGKMAIKASKDATRDAFLYNQRIQEQTQKDLLRGVVLSLQTEIRTLLRIYEDEFLDAIQVLEDGTSFEYYYPISQGYFTLYEANSRYIGLLPDDELRNLIIETYLNARTIIETHLHNNQMLDESDRLHVLNAQGTTPEIQHQIELADQQLREYGINIKNNYNKALELIKKLNARIDIIVPDLLSAYSDKEEMKIFKT